MVTAVQVAADLADLEGGPASCTAEEMVRHAVGVIAGEFCETVGLGRPWLDPDEYLLEDADFEFLYGKDMDGLPYLGFWAPASAGAVRGRTLRSP
jgi:hypothetical protein